MILEWMRVKKGNNGGLSLREVKKVFSWFKYQGINSSSDWSATICQPRTCWHIH
jgi:hypothetical protein